MLNIIQNAFPDGELVSFEDIRKGDTIIRGGSTSYGEQMLNGIAILRASSISAYDDFSEWVPDERGYSGAVATTNPDAIEAGQWLYRLNLDAPLPVDEPTNDKWVASIVALFNTAFEMKEIKFDAITAGDWLLVVDSIAGDVTDDSFGGEIYFGKTNKFDEERKGWLLSLTDKVDSDMLLAFEFMKEANDDVYHKVTFPEVS